eukprot:11927846-Heterocapsa_arctica.AAC.1
MLATCARDAVIIAAPFKMLSSHPLPGIILIVPALTGDGVEVPVLRGILSPRLAAGGLTFAGGRPFGRFLTLAFAAASVAGSSTTLTAGCAPNRGAAPLGGAIALAARVTGPGLLS